MAQSTIASASQGAGAWRRSRADMSAMVQSASSGSTRKCGRASIPGATQARLSASVVSVAGVESHRSSQRPSAAASTPAAAPVSSITPLQPASSQALAMPTSLSHSCAIQGRPTKV